MGLFGPDRGVMSVLACIVQRSAAEAISAGADGHYFCFALKIFKLFRLNLPTTACSSSTASVYVFCTRTFAA